MENDQLKVIFLKGWISSDIMEHPDWLSIWHENAQKAEAEGFQLVIFRIPTKPPHKADPEAIEEIERLLQQKYPHHANKKPTEDH